MEDKLDEQLLSVISPEDEAEAVPNEDCFDIPLVVSIDKVTQAIFGFGALGGSEETYEKIQRCVGSGYPGVRLFLGQVKDKKYKVTGVRYDVQISGKSPKPLDGYDAAVFEAVCSLAKEGHDVFSPRQVLDKITGKKNRSHTESKAIDEVCESLLRMARTWISFNWTGHAVLKKIDQNGKPLNELSREEQEEVLEHLDQECTVGENLLTLKYATLKNNNDTYTRGFKLITTSDLYKYANIVGQIATIEPEYLAVPGVRANRTSIQLTHYIARRVKSLKYQDGKKKDSVSPVIKMDTLFDRCNISSESRTQAKRVKDTVYRILEHYVREGIISDYARYEDKKGSVYKVEIIL